MDTTLRDYFVEAVFCITSVYVDMAHQWVSATLGDMVLYCLPSSTAITNVVKCYPGKQ